MSREHCFPAQLHAVTVPLEGSHLIPGPLDAVGSETTHWGDVGRDALQAEEEEAVADGEPTVTARRGFPRSENC